MQVMVEISNPCADFALSVLRTLSFVKKAEPFSYENLTKTKEKKLSAPHINTNLWKFDREQANEQ